MGYDWNHTRQLSSDKKFFNKQMQDISAVFEQWKQEQIDTETFKTNMEQLLREQPPEIEPIMGFKF